MEPITFSVFSENHVGLLQRVTAVFTRRCINIESLTVSASEVPGVHRFTIVAILSREMARHIGLQLEKQVEVIRAFVHEETEVLYRDLALYKLPGTARRDPDFHTLVRTKGARVLEESEAFVVLELTGSQEETTAFFDQLLQWGVLEFVRSGRVALNRPMKKIRDHLADMARFQADAKAALALAQSTWPAAADAAQGGPDGQDAVW